ncbi:ATP-binding cassette, subfamily F, member 3 [Fistulifera solaris]|uniref:ATP-binding cassette, subfamily F, member 3 n=1 Tax=Fistulifera solaris TaxID=1519565 RepID=A0A1Z5KCE4_FISSO|nr:ATP-binding cassette, subfamily F, member 3 [Fistulifera solaris]|eukprot:GAX23933.1 ATP-binding cassette, subfamily F, member 3 [Fistulifera solaris]
MHVEEELSQAFSALFLEGDEQVEGLDEDLVAYISGMLSSKVAEDEDLDVVEVLEEVLNPFLESVQCPDDLQTKAQSLVKDLLSKHLSNASMSSTKPAAQKLKQGIVSMSSDLTNAAEHENDANRFLWGTEGSVKAMANDLIDAHKDKASAKDKRKVRKAEAEQARKLLSSNKDEDVDGASGGLVRMNYRKVSGNAATDKARDVQVRNVTISLDNGTVLLDAGELKFSYQRRYGLIGENGVGKSTLLRAIAREDGVEGFPKHLRVLHVRQEVPSHLATDLTVIRAVLDSDIERNELMQQEKELLAKLEQAGDEGGLSLQDRRKKLTEQSTEMKELSGDLKKLDQIYARLQVLSSDSAEARASMILSGLQFTHQMQTAPISSLSGGWKMRVALAAALFIAPDLLMLDEPTNHLDLEAVLWLESYLVEYKHTLIVVSHDRGFLNSVCTDIMELKHKKLTYYRGGFDDYVKQRDENTRNKMRAYQAYQSKREHMMEFIDKFRANAKRATMVQSRIKAVEKMDAEAPELVETDQVWRFSIPNAVHISPPWIAINDVSFDYNPVRDDGSKKPENEFLLQQVNFGVAADSRIVILGANGQGKTTLLNLIMGKLKPVKGSVSINPSLRIGHFTQHSSDNFNLKLSAVENLMDMFDAEDQEMRSFLGKFQIQGNDALKPMMLLSGGQKSRVAFAALAYKKPHVLVIDEGSNHLDMGAVDALVEAVQDFKGGVLVVSHDQYFVSKTCSELWVVHEGKATRFRGDFNDYKKFTAEMTQKRVDESMKKIGMMGV